MRIGRPSFTQIVQGPFLPRTKPLTICKVLFSSLFFPTLLWSCGAPERTNYITGTVTSCQTSMLLDSTIVCGEVDSDPSSKSCASTDSSGYYFITVDWSGERSVTVTLMAFRSDSELFDTTFVVTDVSGVDDPRTIPVDFCLTRQ